LVVQPPVVVADKDPETEYAKAMVDWAANLLADYFNGKILDYEGEVF